MSLIKIKKKLKKTTTFVSYGFTQIDGLSRDMHVLKTRVAGQAKGDKKTTNDTVYQKENDKQKGLSQIALLNCIGGCWVTFKYLV